MKKLFFAMMLSLSMMFLVSCDIGDILGESSVSPDETNHQVDEDNIISLEDLQRTEHFRNGALAHILEGELNGRGQAVGFHYDGLPSKKGNIISGTETTPNEHGVFEAKVEVEGIKKASNSGRSSFFPNDWNAQEVVDAINAAYETREFINGNTYEGLDTNGVVIRMYLDDQDRIISAFPVY